MIYEILCIRYRTHSLGFMAFIEISIVPSSVCSRGRNIFCRCTNSSFAMFFCSGRNWLHWNHSLTASQLLLALLSHVSRSKISYNQDVYQVNGLWLSNLHKYSNSVNYVVCVWAEVSRFHVTLPSAEHQIISTFAKGHNTNHGKETWVLVPQLRKMGYFVFFSQRFHMYNLEPRGYAWFLDISFVHEH